MNTKNIFLSFFVIFGLTFISAQKSYRALVYEGNKKFDGKDYDGASSSFMEAIKSNSKDFTAHYNLGNSLYKSKKYEDAKVEFEKAKSLSKNNEDKAAALYNLGNTYMQTNNAAKAADYYKQSLKLNPYSEPTRKNFEIAKLKEKQNQQNKNQDQQSGKNGGGKDQQKNKDQQGDPKDKNQDQGNGIKNNGQSPSGKNADQNKKNEGSKMPKELQNAILDKVGEREKETAKRILNKSSFSMPESKEKDW